MQYRVVREVRYPIWWSWRCWWNPPQPTPQEIAHGTATTDTDGKFDGAVRRPARPSVSEKDEPIFQFTVYADVTDTTGETRSRRAFGQRRLHRDAGVDDCLTGRRRTRRS